MKKYILTIKYNEETGKIDYIEEHLETTECVELNEETISKLTTQDLLEIMFHKDYAKA